MRILTFSSLYPNEAQPHHGIFVENRLRQIEALGGVAFRVVAPVPWFPIALPLFGRYGVLAGVPARETRHGIEVMHPRYPVIPKVGMSLAPSLMARWMRPVLARLIEQGHDFDLIDAHYFYPDGVAAARLARDLGKPLVITARGSDINLIPRHPGPRRQILRAAAQADALISVSEALRQEMIGLGMAAEKITALRNGVDLERFRPTDGAAFREAWSLGRPLLVSVGNLVPLKGHEQVIRALEALPEAHLAIVGSGPDAGRLTALARSLGLESRVRLIGAVGHADLAEVYSAADVLVLASSSEGWPNVLLEAMACGTAVVATARGGMPEVVTTAAAGRLIETPSPDSIAREVTALLDDPPARAAVRAHAEGFDWTWTATRQLALYREIVGDRSIAGS